MDHGQEKFISTSCNPPEVAISFMQPDPAKICFGLTPELDRSSCALYLQLLGRKECAELLARRLSSEEIDELINIISTLMRNHLSKKEYHHLFLGEEHHSGEYQDLSS